MLTVEIKTPKIDVGSFFNEYYQILAKNRVGVETKIKKMLQDYARNNHNYTKQTGRLRASTKAVGSLRYEDEIKLYADETQADYAKYVVYGNGSWAEDRFIEKAVRDNLPQITRMIIKLYNDAVQEFNRRK